MLAAVDYSSPLLWAILIGWIMSVVLHEFAHGLVAYLGGDYTIKERGGLTLNPIQYVDPLMSLILPAVFLLMGGIPLPGGATYIRRDLLRSRLWSSAVSAAGPAMNLLIFLVLALLVSPRAGWVSGDIERWTTAQVFAGAMAFLQLFAAVLNLTPIPPLDGFQIISPFLSDDLRLKLTRPPIGTILFIGFFILLISGGAAAFYVRQMQHLVEALGFDFISLYRAFRLALWGQP